MEKNYIATPDIPAKLQKLDKNGNIVKTVDLSYRMDRFSDFISDNDNLYLSGTYNNHYDDYLYVLDKSLNIIQHRNTRADALITSDNSSYIFFSDGRYLYDIEKSNFISGDKITINFNPPYNVTTILPIHLAYINITLILKILLNYLMLKMSEKVYV